MNSTPNPPHPILVVDDDESVLLAIDTTLRMNGWDHVITCGDSRLVMDLLKGQPIEMMLLDLTMPHVSGEELLFLVKAQIDVPVVIVTGVVDVSTAVRCIKAGAFDYVVKPVDEDQLVTVIERALSFQSLKKENLALKRHILSDLTDELDTPEAFEDIITANKKMLLIFQYVESIAGTAQPVLITGETGVGKELVARAVHHLSGVQGQFVAINAAGLDDNVFSDTLFGHVRGAFTSANLDRPGLIERARKGSLFLDEIGDLSPTSQVKLLRLLQEREYFSLGADQPRHSDARIIAATNHNLDALTQSGQFRKDLNYRLRTHRIHIPPLCERLDDIELLTDYFLEEAAAALNCNTPTPPKELYKLLRTYSFPGNIRELKAMVFDAVSRHKAGILSLDVFKTHIFQDYLNESGAGSDHTSGSAIQFPQKMPTIKQATQILIDEALQRADGNQTIAAKMLGISQQALSKRLKKSRP
jgi:DNA-binding NtrC family response regulator